MIKHPKITSDVILVSVHASKQGEWSQHWPLLVPHVFDIMANGTFYLGVAQIE